VLVVVIPLPVAQSYRAYVGNLLEVLKGKPSVAIFEVQRTQVVREAMADWMRANTPPTAGWLDADEKPHYAVLAPWSGGHVVKYVAHRPVVWDNFGDDVGRENFVAARSYYGSLNEEQALLRIDGLGVRYVVAREDHAKRSGSPDPRTMMSRLSRFNGGEAVLGGRKTEEPQIHLEALKRHRMIYASVPLTAELGRGEPHFKLFELVPGARVSGQAPPGARVMARLALTPLGYPSFFYVATTQADETGRYELTLPYSNEPFSSVVKPGAAYEIGLGRVKVDVRVPEAAVKEGRTVAGPNFQRQRNQPKGQKARKRLLQQKGRPAS
jgi:asparagine N-glycosylation enzyme membrane subunit Stt3